MPENGLGSQDGAAQMFWRWMYCDDQYVCARPRWGVGRGSGRWSIDQIHIRPNHPDDAGQLADGMAKVTGIA